MEKLIDERIEENEKLIFYIINRKFPSLVGDEDIVQIARIAIWEGTMNYSEKKPDVKESTWLSRCIENQIKDELKKRTAKKRNIQQGDIYEMEIEDKDFDIDENINEEELVHQIEKLLDSTERIIMKKKVEGYETNEIANSIGLSRRSIQRKLKHSREVLKNVLQ